MLAVFRARVTPPGAQPGRCPVRAGTRPSRPGIASGDRAPGGGGEAGRAGGACAGSIILPVHPDYPIRTERLILRPFTPGDVDDLHAYRSRADVARYLYSGPSASRQATSEEPSRRTGETRLVSEGDRLWLAVLLAESGALVGDVLLRYTSAVHRQGEIAFVFNPSCHGRGLATEAARAMLRLAFAEMGLHRVIGRCDARNGASARLMERLGMAREAHFIENEFVKGEWTGKFVYAIREQQWSGEGRTPVAGVAGRRQAR